MPENPQDYLEQGNKLFDQGDYAGALLCYDKALEIDPNYALAWYNKGVALGNLRKYQEAINCHDKALEIDPSYALAWHNKGVALGNLRRHQEAINCHDKALEIDPKYALAWHNKGVELGNLGRHQESIESHNKALEIDPKFALAWYNKGVALGNLGKYQEAIESYNKALEIDPSYAPAWNNKGWALGNLGRYVEEINCYDKALNIDSNFALAWNNKGDILLRLKRYDEAEKTYQSAEKINKTWFFPYLGLAKVYIELGDQLGERELYEDALEHLNKVIRLGIPKEKEADYYLQRGYTNAKLGRWREAERDFRQCEGDPKAERNLRRIRNRIKGEGQTPKALFAGGLALAGISIAGLTASFVLHLLEFKEIIPISPDLLKVLVPAFLFFIALGFALPYIRAVKGPAGIGFEKEITTRPESAPAEIKLEPPR